MTEISIEPFTQVHLDGGLQLDVRTGTEGYYERLGTSRSLGFRLTRKDFGLDGTDAK